MKTGLADAASSAAPIVQLAGVAGEGPEPAAATPEDAAQLEAAVLTRARAFAEPLLATARLDTGENALAHADGLAAILQAIGAAPSMRAAAYLVYAGDYLARPEDVIAKAFGESYASLVTHTRKLVQAQRNAREAMDEGALDAAQQAAQIERVRKMLLAFSRDLRVVLLRLASRLQTLRWHAASKLPCPKALARESAQVFAPLANRLGIWQIKWEIEDLAFRFLQPDEYQRIARLQGEKRVEREQEVEAARRRLEAALHATGLRAQVQGRPKHFYSIWKKMQGKQLAFDEVLDVRALRVIVDDVAGCYAALGRVQQLWRTVAEAFDDYIARPKPNGYQSLHTVALDERGRAIEIQIRTVQMHEHAESGVAAHWAYKEAGARGYAGVSAGGDFEDQVAQARKAVLRQLLAWEREVVTEPGGAGGAGTGEGLFDDRIYVFTPQASIIELPTGATPVDFAYTLHTDLGHRCRGARVDGAMAPLNTPLQSGQTVEVVSAKEGGPSLDWLNGELGYLRSSRARTKVRAWFNALSQQQTIARGREAVEKLLQREGRTAIKLEDLASQLGFRTADALFEVVGKDEFSLRNIENLLRPPEPQLDPDELLTQRLSRGPRGDATPRGGVLVVGVESLLTQLARCCKPAPPDIIGGYVTRGKGVAVHRASCANFRQMARRTPERVIPVAWGSPRVGESAVYPADVIVEAADRQGLLRDLSELFAKEKMNVVGVQTRSLKGSAWMSFTVEVTDSARLQAVLASVCRIDGVRSARRR
ncbi:bifunctional (p)ppGpp synthetase/guanosine-3',5'-bis(diphosphate) 3'-pyrophosphohydrolase [Methylibium sp.]|uniref:RelA/SpoT family protein n=1 Tax=Methylibium sp. TaxID=2067992 RepID=UPI0017FC7209|nr:bifunctional (p)ppGpp synthetase/guanosine-3',5'-bis(diphosphate) 3'-pyrophosphohydrolase [Methylibium sp.]MBA3590103.1 bifunctional (p)ppGpp synthetase/guanosine-3',5'-bis(diphosphate) 3'-pyrophosphohydrolase [Methylibium sp.]